MKRNTLRITAVLCIVLLLCSCGSGVPNGDPVAMDEIPTFSGQPYVEIDGNIPDFTPSDLVTEGYETYAPLDSLGRCGVTMACVGPETMPTEERGEIGQVKPSGWHTVRYDIVDGKYLYNRCHLIGYQLTGENANVCNLITGTRYLNVEGMLPFENEIADYVQETGNHVIYRVTPIFSSNELVARGVQMEAKSVEDNGAGVCFNVYAYNAQPGITIDYATGNSHLTGVATETTAKTTLVNGDYVLNTSSKKFHEPSCESVKKIKTGNRENSNAPREYLISIGYEPCKSCDP